jgi:predicted transcriptional regulator
MARHGAAMTNPDAPSRDDQAVGRFIERFASLLVDAGVPRMPARIFVALLAADSNRLTAADLGALLQASPAAVSGGVRYLVQVGLVSREGEPGSRRHHYRVPGDVWNELLLQRDRLLQRWADVLREGIEILGAGTPAGVRMAESAQYFDFVTAELPLLLARWREHRAALGPGS